VANARSFTDDGFYRTGDRVQQLPGGYLVVQGRAGDHINRAGEKISAEEIEDHLLAHPVCSTPPWSPFPTSIWASAAARS
jgi:2,3-dihydroxybenzoate-AMP ligase